MWHRRVEFIWTFAMEIVIYEKAYNDASGSKDVAEWKKINHYKTTSYQGWNDEIGQVHPKIIEIITNTGSVFQLNIY